MDKKTNIIETNIINRFKLLMEYDTKKTLTENSNLIFEVDGTKLVKGLLGLSDDVVTNLLKKGTLKTTEGVVIKSVDDLQKYANVLDDVSHTFLTTNYLKNPNFSIADKGTLIKNLTNSDDIINKYKHMSQEDIVKLFKKDKYPEEVAKEIANKLKNRSVGSTNTLTSAEKAEYNKLAAADKLRLNNKKLGQHTRERLIQKVTASGKPVKLKATKTAPETTSKIQQQMADVNKIAVAQKWKWPDWLKWAVPLGISAFALWHLIANFTGDNAVTPDDMPLTDENLESGQNPKCTEVTGLDTGVIYNYEIPGDRTYIYGIGTDKKWYTKNRTTNKEFMIHDCYPTTVEKLNKEAVKIAS
jgi:hypothetical protein